MPGCCAPKKKKKEQEAPKGGATELEPLPDMNMDLEEDPSTVAAKTTHETAMSFSNSWAKDVVVLDEKLKNHEQVLQKEHEVVLLAQARVHAHLADARTIAEAATKELEALLAIRNKVLADPSTRAASEAAAADTEIRLLAKQVRLGETQERASAELACAKDAAKRASQVSLDLLGDIQGASTVGSTWAVRYTECVSELASEHAVLSSGFEQVEKHLKASQESRQVAADKVSVGTRAFNTIVALSADEIKAAKGDFDASQRDALASLEKVATSTNSALAALDATDAELKRRTDSYNRAQEPIASAFYSEARSSTNDAHARIAEVDKAFIAAARVVVRHQAMLAEAQARVAEEITKVCAAYKQSTKELHSASAVSADPAKSNSAEVAMAALDEALARAAATVEQVASTTAPNYSKASASVLSALSSLRVHMHLNTLVGSVWGSIHAHVQENLTTGRKNTLTALAALRTAHESVNTDLDGLKACVAETQAAFLGNPSEFLGADGDKRRAVVEEGFKFAAALTQLSTAADRTIRENAAASEQLRELVDALDRLSGASDALVDVAGRVAANTAEDKSDPRTEILTKRPGHESLGMQIRTGEGEQGVRVVGLTPGGLAAESGRIYPNDAIISVNNKDVRTLPHEEVVASLKVAGSTVELVVSRSFAAPLSRHTSSIKRISNKRLVTLVRSEKGLGLSIRPGADNKGAFVDSVIEGTPAAECGQLHTGDVILEVNGVNVQHEEQQQIVRLLKAENTVNLVVSDGESAPETPVPAAATPSPTPAATEAPAAAAAAASAAASVDPLVRYEVRSVAITKDAKGMGLKIRTEDGEGCRVSEVIPDGAADRTARIFQGDAVWAVNGDDVTSSTHSEIVAKLQSSNPVTLLLAPDFPSTSGRREVLLRRSASKGLGLTIQQEPSGRGARVRDLIGGGPAEGSRRIKPGDAILSINDVDVSNDTHDAIVGHLKSAEGLKIVLDDNFRPKTPEETRGPAAAALAAAAAAIPPPPLEDGDYAARFPGVQNVRKVTVTKVEGSALGMHLRSVEDDPYIRVSRLVEGGLADKSGLIFPNDAILDINGTPCYKLPHDSVVDIIKANQVLDIIVGEVDNAPAAVAAPVAAAAATVASVAAAAAAGPVPGEVREVTIERSSTHGLGVTIKTPENGRGCQILDVIADSPAAASGKVFVNDRMVEVNGVNVEDEPHEEIVARLKSRPTITLKLVQDPTLAEETPAAAAAPAPATAVPVPAAPEAGDIPRDVREVVLDRPANAGYGFKLRTTEDDTLTRISEIIPGQLAEQSGNLFVNDAILALNGEDVTALQHEDIVERLRNAQGQVRFRVQNLPLIVPSPATVSENGTLGSNNALAGNPNPVRKIVLRRPAAGGLGFKLRTEEDRDGGFISEIIPGGAASKEDVHVGDKIISVNGKDLTSAEHDAIVAAITSGGDEITIELQAPAPNAAAPAVDDKSLVRVRLATSQQGLGLRLRTPDDGEPTSVIDVIKGGAAEAAGVHVGDIFVSINGVGVEHTDHEGIVALLRSAQVLDIVVRRSGRYEVLLTKGSEPLGLKLRTAEGERYTTVLQTIPGSQAARSVITPGDRLIEVQGINVEGKDHDSITELIRTAPKEVVILLERAPMSEDAHVDLQAVEAETRDRTAAAPTTAAPGAVAAAVAAPAPVGSVHRVVVLKHTPGRGWGLKVRTKDGVAASRITEVVSGGVASESGQLFAGDAIVKINKRNALNVTHDEIVRLLQTQSDVALEVTTGPAKRTVQLARSPETGYGFKIRTDDEKITYVYEIIPDTPAAASDLHQGDFVLEVNGESVEEMTHEEIVAKISGSSSVNLAVEAPLVLAEHPQRLVTLNKEHGRLGLKLQADDKTGGMFVTDVTRDTLADKAGVHPGDRVLAVNNTPVDSTKNVVDITQIVASSPIVSVLLASPSSPSAKEYVVKLERSESEGFGMKLRSEVDSDGIYISEVLPGSPAERGGARVLCYLVELNGENIENLTHEEVVRRLSSLREATLKLREVQYPDGEVPTPAEPIERTVQLRRVADGTFGVAIHANESMGNPYIAGITDAQQGAEHGLRVGDRILKIDGVSVETVGEQGVHAALDNKDAVSVLIQTATPGVPCGPNRRVVKMSRQPGSGFGLKIHTDEAGRTSVLSSVPGSPASTADIRVGDRIVSIDGRNVEALGHDALVAELAGLTVATLVLQGTGSVDSSVDVRTVTLRRVEGGPGFGIKLVTYEGETGCRVSEVIEGGLAHKSGLVFVRDAVLSINGKDVSHSSHDDVIAAIREAAPTVTFTLAAMFPGESDQRRAVLLLRKDNEGLGFKVRSEENQVGAYISHVFPEGPADRAGLRPGDHIISVDGTHLEDRSHEDVVAALRAAGARVEIVVEHRAVSEADAQRAAQQVAANIEPERVVTFRLNEGSGLGLKIATVVGDAGGVISEVVPGGLAALSGRVFVGDRIVRVNGQDMSKAQHEDLVNAIKSSGSQLELALQQVKLLPDGVYPNITRYALTLMRNGRPLGLQIQSNSVNGLTYVHDVSANSPAMASGIAVGDLLLSVNGHSTVKAQHDDVVELLRQADPATLELGRVMFSRGDVLTKVEGSYGLTLKELPGHNGAQILGIARNGPAAKTGKYFVGDRVYAVDGFYVYDSPYAEILSHLQSKDKVLLLVQGQEEDFVTNGGSNASGAQDGQQLAIIHAETQGRLAAMEHQMNAMHAILGQLAGARHSSAPASATDAAQDHASRDMHAVPAAAGESDAMVAARIAEGERANAALAASLAETKAALAAALAQASKADGSKSEREGALQAQLVSQSKALEEAQAALKRKDEEKAAAVRLASAAAEQEIARQVALVAKLQGELSTAEALRKASGETNSVVEKLGADLNAAEAAKRQLAAEAATLATENDALKKEVATLQAKAAEAEANAAAAAASAAAAAAAAAVVATKEPAPLTQEMKQKSETDLELERWQAEKAKLETALAEAKAATTAAKEAAAAEAKPVAAEEPKESEAEREERVRAQVEAALAEQRKAFDDELQAALAAKDAELAEALAAKDVALAELSAAHNREEIETIASHDLNDVLEQQLSAAREEIEQLKAQERRRTPSPRPTGRMSQSSPGTPVKDSGAEGEKYVASKTDNIDRAVGDLVNTMGVPPSAVKRLGGGKYMLFNDPRVVSVRVVGKVVMVRVGGGWQNMKEYLKEHDGMKELITKTIERS